MYTRDHNGNLLEADEDRGERIRCRACGAALSELDDVVDLTTKDLVHTVVHGELPVHAFVNPEGSKFEVATVRDASVTATGPWSSDATFFHNYEWKVIRCSRCGMQVGWWYRVDPQGACAAAHPNLDHHHHHHEHEHDHDHHGHMSHDHEQDHHHQRDPPQTSGTESKPPTQTAKALAQEESRRASISNSHEDSANIQWVLESLENVCLEKDLGDHVLEWCYEKAAQVRKKATDAVVQILGTQQSLFQGRLSEAPAHELGGKPRPYFPIQLTRGSSCNFDEDHQNSAQIHLMCCDSFPATRHTVDSFQRKHMRIEQARSRRPCTFELYVCVPRICLVPPFAILRHQISTKASGNSMTRSSPPAVESTASAQQGKIAHEFSKAMAKACPLRNFYGLIREHIIVDGAQDALWMKDLKFAL
ncbi:Protein cereblon [Hondaea fermentalgiana]|uniref:Protein cereblon n=1 Tax=Hondaea fermentalgiana TaxID=2315210 RepID=A0A2R5G2W3_9STRA|nr:Protein cereblon [Hondaea fermentalgiana]|eukprot:GBG24068.1 Protein cereblon [Hondaea fermentalgiana]